VASWVLGPEAMKAPGFRARWIVLGVRPSIAAGDRIDGGGGYAHLDDVPDECIANNEYDEYAIWQTVDG